MKDYLVWTWKHKIAFLELEKKLLGKNTFRSYMHDMDKVVLYILFYYINSPKLKKCITWFHKHRSRHHLRASKYEDYLQIVLDWECSRYTKAESQLTAYQFLMTKRQNMIPYIMPILEELNLN